MWEAAGAGGPSVVRKGLRIIVVLLRGAVTVSVVVDRVARRPTTRRDRHRDSEARRGPKAGGDWGAHGMFRDAPELAR